jgi:hypothetical protein
MDDDSWAYLYGRVLDRALDPLAPLCERQAAGRFLHDLADERRHDPPQRSAGVRETTMGDLIRAALHHRIDGG